MPTAIPVRFLCICSGLSAPTQAWKRRGWEALAYAEIDPFASAVLAFRYGAGRPRYMPDPEATDDLEERARRRNAIKALDRIEWGSKITNEGDFTRLRDEPLIADADVLVGGTPCQAFSLAGLRGSLSDDRGNLALEFLRLADAIDDLRGASSRPPAVVLWENVPGVLSTRDNAFGTFLGGMVGSDSPLDCSRHGGWPDAGVVAGPRRVAAWRTLDAQHRGLAQRRRRVFVLASGYPRGWAVANALLPIIDSMCGHPPPRREPRAGVARALGASSGGASAKEQQHTFVGGEPLNDLGRGAGGDRRPSGGVGYGGNRRSGPLDVATARLAHGGPHGHMDFETETFVVEDEPIPYDLTQITHPENRANPRPGDPAPTLSQSGQPPAIAFSSKDDGGDAGELAPTLRAMNFDASHPNAGGQIAVAFSEVAAPLLAGSEHAGLRTTDVDTGTYVAVAFSMRGREGENQCEPEPGDVSPAIRTGGGDSSKPFVAYSFVPEHGQGADLRVSEIDTAPAITATAEAQSTDRGVRIVQEAVAFQERGRHGERSLEVGGDTAYALTAPSGGSRAQEKLVAISSRQEEAVAFTIAKGSNGYAWESDVAPALMTQSPNPGQNLFSGVRTSSAVRRLTPVECERLQGFPDNFTLIPYSDARRSPEDMAETVAYLEAHGFGANEARALAETPDGPRYRGLGNSMAVDVIADLGERIAWVLEQ